MGSNRQRSAYFDAKIDSIIISFTISTIVQIALSYITIDAWWGKLIFEILSRVLVFLVSWKFVAEIILKVKIKNWEKKNASSILKGDWYVIHYSEDERYKNYLRFGEVKIVQNMDEYYLVEGHNYSPNTQKKLSHSSWRSAGRYIYSNDLKELSGMFDVVRAGAVSGNTDGMHIITVIDSKSLMEGFFYNANSDETIKPSKGISRFYRDSKSAMEFYNMLCLERDLETYNDTNSVGKRG